MYFGYGILGPVTMGNLGLRHLWHLWIDGDGDQLSFSVRFSYSLFTLLTRIILFLLRWSQLTTQYPPEVALQGGFGGCTICLHGTLVSSGPKGRVGSLG